MVGILITTTTVTSIGTVSSFHAAELIHYALCIDLWHHHRLLKTRATEECLSAKGHTDESPELQGPDCELSSLWLPGSG